MNVEVLKEHLKLTTQQAEVALLLSQGYETAEISVALRNSQDNINDLISAARKKVGARNRVELARKIWEIQHAEH